MERTSVLSGRQMMLGAHSIGAEGGRKMQCFFFFLIDASIHYSFLYNFWLPMGSQNTHSSLPLHQKSWDAFQLNTSYHNQLHP